MIQRIKNRIKAKIASFLLKFFPTQIATYRLPVEFCPNGPILIVAPHNDDELIGCGALISKYGNICDVLVCTVNDDDKTTDTRQKESLQYCKKYGANLIPNKLMIDGKPKSLQRQNLKIDLIEYAHIFVPSVFERHPDHVAITQLILNETRKYPLELYFYEVWSSLPYFDFFCSHHQNKIDDMDIFHSQIASYPYKELIENRSRYRAVGLNSTFAEAYLKIK